MTAYIQILISSAFETIFLSHWTVYKGVSKSFRTGRLERALQMVQLSATRCSWIALFCESV